MHRKPGLMRQLPESWRLARVQSFNIRWIAVSFWPTIDRFNLVQKINKNRNYWRFLGSTWTTSSGPITLRIRRPWKSSITCRTSSSSANGTLGPRRRSSRIVEHKSPKLQMAIGRFSKVITSNGRSRSPYPRSARTRTSLRRRMSAPRYVVFWVH